MKKKKSNWQIYIGMAVMVLGGALCGFFTARYMDVNDIAAGASDKDFVRIALEILVVGAAFYAQIILHEAGHLLFGLLTGYKFSSFRVGSVMLVRENGKFRIAKMRLAGTGGQCLMAPPDMVDGRIPVMLYNFGGSILNLVTAAAFLYLAPAFEKGSLMSLFCFLSAGIGLVFSLVNGIPMQMGLIDNDGRNAFTLYKDPKSLKGFWIQLKVSDMQSKGIRLKDMPGEWFEVPSEDAMKNSMLALVGVFAANRLMDEHRFEEADTFIKYLLDLDSGIAGIHRNLLRMDRLYCELIHENRPEEIQKLWTGNLKKFARTMKDFPSVMRTEYVYTLLHSGDEARAEKIRKRFEKEMKRYPYPSDVQSERELMEIAEKKYKNTKQ